MTKSLNSLQDDFDLKYAGCCVKLHNSKGEFLGVGIIKGDVYIPYLKMLVGKDGKKVSLSAMEWEEMSYKEMYFTRFVPERGYYSDSKNVYYVTRNATKQWKVSYSEGYYSVKMGGKLMPPLSQGIISAIITDVMLPLNKSLDMIHNHSIDMAVVSREICLYKLAGRVCADINGKPLGFYKQGGDILYVPKTKALLGEYLTAMNIPHEFF